MKISSWINKLRRVVNDVAGPRLGCELGYIENLIRPVDLRKPDEGPYKIASPLERFYIRIFGLPDTVKQQQARVIFRLLEKFSFSSALDVGCSYGHYSIRIAKKYPNSIVVGVDLDEKRLSVGNAFKVKANLKNIVFEKADVCETTFERKFDLVLLLQVIEHLESDVDALKNIRKIINENGHLIITAPNLESPLLGWYKKYVTIKGHLREGYTLNELIRILYVCGFKVKESMYLSGKVGQCVEKIETFIKINARTLFALVYPFLNFLTLIDDYIMNKTPTSGSGILIVATVN